MSNFNDSAQLYFAVGIYCLHGKLTMVWNLHWSEFHYAWSHVNSDNEVTSHQSEILPWSEISNQFDFTLGLMLTLAKISFANSCTWKWAIPEKKLNRLRIYFFEKIPWDFSFFYFTPGNSRQNSSTPGYSTKLF